MDFFSSFRPSETGLGARSPGATVTRVRSDIASLAIAAALHLVIGGVHQYAHAVAEVESSPPLQVLFNVLGVTTAPWAAIWLAWRRYLTIGAVIFSVSMAASLVFGLVLHFAVESPDLYSNVAPVHRTLFLHSAMALALMGFVGFVLRAHGAIRSRHPV